MILKKLKMSRLIKSFGWALNGLKDCILHEKNFRIQYIIALGVLVAGFFFSISLNEWMIILLSFAIVLCFEIINSAIEKLCDLVMPEYHAMIKKVKDMSATAVLLAAIISFIIGCIIFLPKIISLF